MVSARSSLAHWLLAAAAALAAASARADPPRGDHYEVLGLGRNASQEQIRKAFRKLALEHHPDKGGSGETMRRLNEAYATLGDPDKRRRYDQAPPAARSSRAAPGFDDDVDERAPEFGGPAWAEANPYFAQKKYDLRDLEGIREMQRDHASFEALHGGNLPVTWFNIRLMSFLSSQGMKPSRDLMQKLNELPSAAHWEILRDLIQSRNYDTELLAPRCLEQLFKVRHPLQLKVLAKLASSQGRPTRSTSSTQSSMVAHLDERRLAKIAGSGTPEGLALLALAQEGPLASHGWFVEEVLDSSSDIQRQALRALNERYELQPYEHTRYLAQAMRNPNTAAAFLELSLSYPRDPLAFMAAPHWSQALALIQHPEQLEALREALRRGEHRLPSTVMSAAKRGDPNRSCLSRLFGRL